MSEGQGKPQTEYKELEESFKVVSGELVVTDPATYTPIKEEDENKVILCDPRVKNVRNGNWKVKYAHGM